MSEPQNVKDYIHVDRGGNRQNDEEEYDCYGEISISHVPDFVRLARAEASSAMSSLCNDKSPIRPEDGGYKPNDLGYNFIANNDNSALHALRHMEACMRFLMMADSPHKFLGDEEFRAYSSEQISRWDSINSRLNEEKGW
jgi:hypothetical protein